MIITGTHDPALVTLSILIAVSASYTALDLASRVRASTGWLRFTWLATAAVAMGGGIWAMHFVAMLAFSTPGMEMTYDVSLTVLSLVVAIAATGTGFLVISRGDMRLVVLGAAGLFMGLGIVAMHYIGMSAMNMYATLHYDRVWVVTSIVIAISAATVALWLAVRTSRIVVKAIAAVAMGLAVSGMHYAGMRGASFSTNPAMDMGRGHGSLGQATLASAVAASTFLILSLALLAAAFDRRLAGSAEREARALRQSEERFRSLYTRTPLPLHALDRDGRIEHVSDAWLELLGFSREEVTGQALVSFMNQASARQCESDWPVLLETGLVKSADYQMLTKAGELRDVIASAQVENDQEGRFLRILGGLADVTNHRRAEDALRQAQKMEAVGQLTGGVAHDFNNLLTIIRSSVDLLRRPGLQNERRSRYLDAVSDTVDRAAKLTGQLLAFARRQALKPEVFDVGPRLRSIADMLDTVTGVRIRIILETPDAPCCVKADLSQFETAIVNMALNARDAMNGAGTLTMRLTCGGAKPPIRGHAAAEGPFAAVALSDTGAGIPDEYLERIFEPFFTTKAVGKGTGLGLSQVFGFAKQSGGDVAVRSTIGQGTTFSLYLPQVEEQIVEPRIGGQAGEHLPNARGERILVVEDNLEVGSFAVQVLADLGYETDWATTAEEALATVDKESNRFDVVFSDVVMPGMGGLELARILRCQRPELPVVLASGYSDVLARDEEHGFTLLQKPYSAEQLLRILRTASAGRKARFAPIPLKNSAVERSGLA